MEKSKLENMSDGSLLKYVRYVEDVVKDEFSNWYSVDIDDFFNYVFNTPVIETKISGPVGSLSRLDIEYIFYVLKNSALEAGSLIRPKLSETPIDYVTAEKVFIRYTRSGSIQTYLGNDLTNGYLFYLKEEGDFDPWSWEVIDEDMRDSSINDEWFDV
jgi:hypothetical protein